MADILTAEEKQDYRTNHPDCEVWPLMTARVRDDLCDLHGTIRLRYERRLPACELAHICRGPGRQDYAANLLHLSRDVHVWCDGHGSAGQVLLFGAKFLSGGADWELWDRLFTGATSIRGRLETDRVMEKCDAWDVESIRLMLRDGRGGA